MLLPRDALEIDPRLTGDAYGMKVSRLIFASLVTIDPYSLKPVPDLAESVEVINPRHYRGKLRKNLKLSGGSVLDATGVAATFYSVLDPEIGSRYAGAYRRIERIETLDPLTIDFYIDGPHATFLTDLELPVLRSEDAQVPVGAPGGPEPVGAGPYRLVARKPGVMELRANPKWHGGHPLFPAIRMLVVQDDNTRALRMVAGAGDLAFNAIPPLLIPLFPNRAGFQVKNAQGIGTTYVGINTQAGPLADVRVRRAVAHAIDRRALVEAKFGGRARLARGWIPPGHWAYWGGTPYYEHNPDLARALLDRAGLPAKGSAPRLELALRTSSDRFRQSIAKAIAEMLRRVGIAVEIRPTEVALLLADLNRGHFELSLLQVPEVIEPHVLSWFFSSDRIPSRDRVEGANRWRFSNAELDAELENGRRTPYLPLRRKAYRQVQRILAEQVPVIPLWHEDNVAVVSRRAGAFRVPVDGRFGTLARSPCYPTAP